MKNHEVVEYRNPKASPGMGLLAFVGCAALIVITIVFAYFLFDINGETNNRAAGKIIFFPLLGSIFLAWTGWQKTLGVSKIVIDGEGISSYTRLSRTFVPWNQIASAGMEDQKQFIGEETPHLVLRCGRGKILMKIAYTMMNFGHLREMIKSRAPALEETAPEGGVSEKIDGVTSNMSDQEKMAALMRKKPLKAKSTFLPKFKGFVFLILGGLFACVSGFYLYIQTGLYFGGTVTEASVTSSRHYDNSVYVEYRYRVPGDFVVDFCNVSHEEWQKIKNGEPFKVRYSNSDHRFSCYHTASTYGSVMITGIFFFIGLVLLILSLKLFLGKREKRTNQVGDELQGPLFE